MSQGPPTPDEAALELLRSRSGLAIDAEGRFLHRGEPIGHARTLAVLWGSLVRDADGRWRVSVGREQAYVEVEETPWVVRAVEVHEAGATLRLAGGFEAPLEPATLSVARDGVLRCRIRGGERARFSRGAQIALGLLLEDDPTGAGWVLTLGGKRWPVPDEP